MREARMPSPERLRTVRLRQSTRRIFSTQWKLPFPGCQKHYNGNAWLDWWDQDPFIGGAYGCYRIGNYTEFAGIENVRQANVHFCGEQTDLNFQGYMEGAVKSGERLAFHWPKL